MLFSHTPTPPSSTLSVSVQTHGPAVLTASPAIQKSASNIQSFDIQSGHPGTPHASPAGELLIYTPPLSGPWHPSPRSPLSQPPQVPTAAAACHHRASALQDRVAGQTAAAAYHRPPEQSSCSKWARSLGPTPKLTPAARGPPGTEAVRQVQQDRPAILVHPRKQEVSSPDPPKHCLLDTDRRTAWYWPSAPNPLRTGHMLTT